MHTRTFNRFDGMRRGMTCIQWKKKKPYHHPPLSPRSVLYVQYYKRFHSGWRQRDGAGGTGGLPAQKPCAADVLLLTGVAAPDGPTR